MSALSVLTCAVAHGKCGAAAHRRHDNAVKWLTAIVQHDARDGAGRYGSNLHDSGWR
jgi:hypothetical protein